MHEPESSEFCNKKNWRVLGIRGGGLGSLAMLKGGERKGGKTATM